MKVPTKTQKQIAQELVRRGYKPAATRQDEYLKLRDYLGNVVWVGRHGEIRAGPRLYCTVISPFAEYRSLKQDAKANYVEED